MRRNYSNGTVTKNHGMWKATISYQEGGKRHRLTKSTGIKCFPGKNNSNKAKAELFLRQWREQLIIEDEAAHTEDDKISFYDYCDQFLSAHNVKEATMAGYRATMKRLLGTTLGTTLLTEVSGDDIRHWEHDLREDGVCEVTLKHHHAFISMVLKHAVATDRILRNPILSVKGPKAKTKPVNSLTREQRAEILSKMDSSSNLPFAMAVRIALLTGMRRGEICALRWCDVDLEERVIHVNHALTCDHGYRLDCPKDTAGGDTTRIIPIGNVLTGYLRTHRKRQMEKLSALGGKWSSDLYVVGNPVSGAFMSPAMLSRLWSSLAQNEGLRGTQNERVRFHDLRHTFATLAIRDRLMDVMSLSKILGHRDASMTLNVYSDALAEAKRSGMDALDATLKVRDEEERPRPRGKHMRAS